MSKIWVWGVDPRGAGPYSFPSEPKVSIAEGAKLLGVDNVFMIVNGNYPEPPFDDVANSLDSFDKVVFSLVGDEGTTRTNNGKTDIDAVCDMAKKHGNIVGGALDDFFRAGRVEGFPAELIAKYKKEMNDKAGKKMDLYGVLYSHEIDEKLKPYFDIIDTLSLWVWNFEDIPHFPEYVKKTREIWGKEKPLLAGVYMWGFYNDIKMPLDAIKMHLDFVKKALDSGDIDGVVFCYTPMADMDYPTVNYAKKWIAENK